MRRLSILLAISALIGFGPYSAGASAGPSSGYSCKATPWPFSRTQSRRDLYKQMEQLDRATLVEYYFGELTQRSHKPSLAQPLAVYLIGTELDPDLRGFFRFLKAGARLNGTSAKPRLLKKGEICDSYGKVLDEIRRRIKAHGH